MITEITVANRTTKCKSMRHCLFCVTVRAAIILTKLIVTNVRKKTKSVFQDHQSILGLAVENLGNFSIKMNTWNHYWDSITCIICPTEQWRMILSINQDKYGISSVKTKKNLLIQILLRRDEQKCSAEYSIVLCRIQSSTVRGGLMSESILQ